MQQWLDEALATVPEHRTFLGVDGLEQGLADLATEFPALVTRTRIGTSRLGDAIHAVRIGDSDRHALVFALPHPNEPVGGLTALHLARRLSEDAELRRRLRLTFTIVACIDPDGLRLNENWLDGPYTRTHYARNFYRPAGAEQVEWTFPIDYHTHYFDAALPETAALVRLIDQLRPELMVSLHNSELGGAYYYLSRPVPDIYPALQEIPPSVGLELDRGEPESPEIEQLSDGIFLGLGIRPVYDRMAAAGKDLTGLAGGDGSGGYAERYGTLTVISEVPYWQHPESSDSTETDENYGDLLGRQAVELISVGELLGRILAAVEPVVSASANPFLSASRFFVPMFSSLPAEVQERAAEPVNERPATVAERFSLADVVRSYKLRYGGMLLRMLDGELAVGNARRVIRESRAELAPIFEQWCAEADEIERQTVVLPIRSLVTTQLGAILLAAEHVTAEHLAGDSGASSR